MDQVLELRTRHAVPVTLFVRSLAMIDIVLIRFLLSIVSLYTALTPCPALINNRTVALMYEILLIQLIPFRTEQTGLETPKNLQDHRN